MNTYEHSLGRRHVVRAVHLLPFVVGLLVLAGCSLPIPQAQSDPTKFYVLSVPGAAQPAPAGASTSAPVVRLRPIEMATYLRGRPMVVRRGENEVQFLEFARWGEPLEQGIGRVLREELLARGAASSVDAGGLRPSDAGDVTFAIGVRVLACEGAADGSVNFRAVWEIAGTAANAAPALHGEFHPTDLKWSPRNDATLAAALSKAVAELAGDIADALAKAK